MSTKQAGSLRVARGFNVRGDLGYFKIENYYKNKMQGDFNIYIKQDKHDNRYQSRIESQGKFKKK